MRKNERRSKITSVSAKKNFARDSPYFSMRTPEFRDFRSLIARTNTDKACEIKATLTQETFKTTTILREAIFTPNV